jgi:DNA-binding NarL/FixJ family response regulator
MDQWDEATWLDNPPVLRAVSGRSLRVLRRTANGTEADAAPAPVEAGGVRVLVVGDDVLARRGVLVALDDQPGLVVVGERPPGPEVAAAIRAHNPDVLLLHGLSRAEAEPTVTAARRASGSVRLLAVGTRSSADDERDLCGRLPASASLEEVVAAVRMAAAGYQLRRGSRPAGSADGRAAAQAKGLTERECDVLTLVAQGMSNAEIAGALTVSEHTVKSHVQNLLGKLKLRNRIHVVIYAFDSGLTVPPLRDFQA